ncbi:MAG: phosphoribosyltransferase family protein [Lachnospirales bacterium]
MEELKQRILNSPNDLERKIVRVDKYINGNVDIKLMVKIAQKMYDDFKDHKIDAIVTVEASGIMPATLVAAKFGIDLLVLKKERSVILDNVYSTDVYSFTKKRSYTITANKHNVIEGANYLLIDDFLAKGQVVQGVVDLLTQGKANLYGASFIIEKGFENTAHIFKDNNIIKTSVVNIINIDNEIIFA